LTKGVDLQVLQEILIPASIIGGMGLIFGTGLAFASKKFAVKVDERVVLVRDALPGANCGACGQTGCDAFAESLVEGTSKINGCPVGGELLVTNLAKIMGMEAETLEAKTARVMCRGNTQISKSKFAYLGIQDCTAAAALYGGPLACTYGCVGLGNCERACPFGAITVENGLARVNESLCTACEKCISACPKHIIDMVPRHVEYAVNCSSLDKGNIVRKNCQVGCIGCGKCSKVCPEGAIKLNGTLAKIDTELCKNCGECIKVCPTNAINRHKCDY